MEQKVIFSTASSCDCTSQLTISSPHQQVSKFSKSRESSVTFLESTDEEAEEKKGKGRNNTNF